MPVYEVVLEGKRHIVVANLGVQAIRHVTRKRVTCQAITAEELAKAVAQGLQIEHADTSKDDVIVPPVISDPFKHKAACGASGAVPIGGPGCKCMQLPLEVEVRDSEELDDGA